MNEPCSAAAMNTKNFGVSIFSVFSEMMAEKNIEFTHEDLVVHHNVYCDPTKMREIFMNLLSNAYKYTKPGGKVHVRLRELPSKREGYGIFETSVSDTGVGMSAEYLSHIFEEFSRENTSTANKIEGTGLGMPIVKRLVELMGGTRNGSFAEGLNRIVQGVFPTLSSAVKEALIVLRMRWKALR